MAVTIVSGEWPPKTQMVTTGEPPALGDLIVMELPDGEQAPSGWTETHCSTGRACWRYVAGGEAWPTRFPSIVVRGVEVATDEGSAIPWRSAP